MGIKEQLGLRIKELRLKNNLKQSELAEIVNIATKHQSCIETGKNYPSADLIEKYAKAFKIDPSELLYIAHKKELDDILNEINSILKNADEEKIRTIYKIIKAVCE